MTKLIEADVLTGVNPEEGYVALCFKKEDGSFEVFRLTADCADTLSRSLAFQAREIQVVSRPVQDILTRTIVPNDI